MNKLNSTAMRLPCPKCGKENEAQMRVRFLPRLCNLFADEDILQTRCIVKEHGCDFWCDLGKNYKLVDIETPNEELIKELMEAACNTFYLDVKERWTKGVTNEDSKL